MARDTRRAYEEALSKLTPRLRRAFEDAVRDIRSGAKLKLVEEAVAAQDWRAVVELLRIDERIFDRLDREVENAFYQGGVYQLARAGGAALVVRFQGRHERAERWVRERSSRLIREIIEDQREAVRVVVTGGIEAGRNPRATALDIVGRVEDGRRKGGIVGLHSMQARWVQNMRAELADPATASGYFDRKARDKRFDPLVKRAIREGKPLSPADIDRIAGRYADKLLKIRGDTIARTETIAAMNAGRYEALRQLVDTGQVRNANQIKLQWSATMDGRTRDVHRLMNGATVRLDEAFVSPETGALLRYPGDTELGAHGVDTINCRCYLQPKINWLAQAR